MYLSYVSKGLVLFYGWSAGWSRRWRCHVRSCGDLKDILERHVLCGFISFGVRVKLPHDENQVFIILYREFATSICAFAFIRTVIGYSVKVSNFASSFMISPMKLHGLNGVSWHWYNQFAVFFVSALYIYPLRFPSNPGEGDWVPVSKGRYAARYNYW